MFAALGTLLGRTLPQSEREAHAVAAFYRNHGPLAQKAFRAALARTATALGPARPLSAYLEHLTRQVHAEVDTDPGDTTDPNRRTER